MLAELRTKSQITLPKETVSSLGLSEGDKLEVFERDGIICMMPVVVYPKSYIDKLNNEISLLKENVRTGKQPTFTALTSLLTA